MKQTLLFCLGLLLLAQLPAHAQSSSSGSQRLISRKATNTKLTGCPRVYIGFSTGINNPVGLIGPQVDLAISPSVSISSGFGLSSWGYKTYLEGRYYFKPCNRGWALAGGFTYSTGGERLELSDQETVYGKADVVVDLEPQANFMVSAYHFFNLGQKGRNRFHLQFGYSLPLGEVGFTQTGGAPLTTKGGDVITAIAPGGLLLGLGFSFGAGTM